MKTYHLIILLTTIGTGINFINLHAQHVMLPEGGNASGSGGTVSYSMGQLTTEKSFGKNGTVSPGIQQPYEIIVNTGSDIQDIDLNIQVFPNPVSTYLILQFDPIKYDNLTYRLYDLQGKSLDIKKVSDSPTTVDMKGYIPSSYILKIYDGQNEIKSFKIIKN